MNFSIDELAASLSSNHIGQEAADLASLQAQLSQMLTVPYPSSSSSFKGAHPGTPIARTPTTTSFCWDRSDRRRSNSVASMSSRKEADEKEFEHVDGMDEDERMVEDMLLSTPPVSPNATPQYASVSPASPAQYTMRSRQASVSTQYPPYELSPSSPSSIFATTDPFYLAQLQAAQAQSFFSQFGKPSQQSPFVKGHTFQGHHFAQQLAGTTC